MRARNPSTPSLSYPALPPPGVQDYHCYSAADQQDFRWTAQGVQLPSLPPPPVDPRRQLRPGAVVFGWHPYWVGTVYASYDFSLLTHVAYYGYRVNHCGDLLLAASAGQQPAGLAAYAHQQNKSCKVLLNIAYPWAEATASLLNSNRLKEQQRLIDTIVQVVRRTGADGVNLDFAPDQLPPTKLSGGHQQQPRLRAQVGRFDSEAETRPYELTTLASQPDSLLSLATQLDLLLDEAQRLTQQQQDLEKRLALHQLQTPKVVPGRMSRVLGWLGLDATAQASETKDKASHERTAQRLREQRMWMQALDARNKQLISLNKILTRGYAARLAANEPEGADKGSLRKQNRQAQGGGLDQRRHAGLAKKAGQRCSSPFAGRPELTPRTNHSRELQYFLGCLAKALHTQDTAAVVTLSVPAVDGTGTYRNLRAVQNFVSLFIIKAFDYTSYNQVIPGALVPLKPSEDWGPHSIETSVAYYLKQGYVPRNQLVVGFPHLGKVWKVDSRDVAEVFGKRPAEYWTNRQLRPLLTHAEAKLDLASLSHRTVVAPDSAGLPPVQVWWEDSASLAPKYDWVLRQHLAGVGIWALGYETDSHQSWKLVARKFTKLSPRNAVPQKPPTHYSLRRGLVLSAVLLLALVLYRRFKRQPLLP
ncbi:hypothetical protein KBK19_19915 [Microvirga sp. STR05]|uniref:Chitinase II/V-like catalytic domain-containing protein n=1 Tax=Hymenobacter duratus TaxID=2771356 RepID=A0ABR8JNW6_9BACT|nr:glycosyl hydrolase family 18 protein [Hymenobacter duratus]MBD2717316.1 hypothetical protein [Hymenobacter duratus]MBR7952237.1 hypothetical protein [Microvirga sp. STR05]